MSDTIVDRSIALMVMACAQELNRVIARGLTVMSWDVGWGTKHDEFMINFMLA